MSCKRLVEGNHRRTPTTDIGVLEEGSNGHSRGAGDDSPEGETNGRGRRIHRFPLAEHGIVLGKNRSARGGVWGDTDLGNGGGDRYRIFRGAGEYYCEPPCENPNGNIHYIEYGDEHSDVLHH